VINSIGNLAGFAGPFAMGVVLMLGHVDANERATVAAE
jgi:hypothetical protein